MNKPPICWKCGKLAAEIPVKIGFKALCPHCSAALHSCVNCRYYMPGKPNDCLRPETDFVRDREGINFCEEFAPKIQASANPSSDSIQKARRLLGDEGPDEKKDFNSLFKE